MTDEVLLSACGLNRRFGPNTVLRDVDITLHRGDILGFLGLNGAGKTTTIEILAGARAPDSGSVSIAGHDLRRDARRARQLCGYLPQRLGQRPEQSVTEAVTLCARLGGVDDIPGAVARTLEQCALNGVRHKPTGQLSRGFQQRLGLACALVHDPQVLLLDEPGTALDPAQIQEQRALIAELGQTRAVLFSTHTLGEVQALANRVAILHEGRIVYDEHLRTTANRVRIALRERIDRMTLKNVADVLEVQGPEQDGGWIVTLVDGDEAVASFARQVVNRNWGLLALEPGYDPLEARFLNCTRGEGT